MNEEFPRGWMWDMFSEYVRKITRTASTGAMPVEEMEKRFLKMHRDFQITLMISDKVGMIVQFLDLETFKFQDLSHLMEEKQFLGFLSDKYGLGKFKVNLHYDWTFVATKNFKIEEGTEKWREILKSRET